VSRHHPFARRGRVRLEELAQDHLILFDRSSSYYELTSSLMRQAGVVPESVIELDNVEAAKKMVAEGLGVALLPRMALAAVRRAHQVSLTIPRGDDRGERAMHRAALRRSRELRVAGGVPNDSRAGLRIAVRRDELGPGEGEPHVDVVRKPRRRAPRVTRAVERRVRRDEADGDRVIAGQLLRGLLEEHRRGERIARRVENLGGELPDERDRAEPSEKRTDELASPL